jgi:endonuclease/exonuclease/phosphatase family metal-dependent hydrolase
MALRKVYNILCCNQTLKKVYLHNGIPRSIFNPLNVTLLNRKIKKILSWNIQELFWYSNSAKLNNILEYIKKSDCDVICLQEVFEISSLERILYNKEILQKYPFSITGCMKSKYLFGENSGLLVLSNQPIQYVKFEPLLPYEFPDSFASKGILYFSVGDKNFAATHLQSGNEVISAQQMRVAQDSSPFGTNFILLGDLNHHSADVYLRCNKNNYTITHDSNRILDYILPMCDSYCNIDIVVDDILEDTSDHWPLICVFSDIESM